MVNAASLLIAVGKLPAVSKAIVKIGSGVTKFLEASAAGKRSLDRLGKIIERVKKAKLPCEPVKARVGLAAAPPIPCPAPPGTTLPVRKPATVGKATSADYKITFFKANPALKNKVWVHHAVEQGVLKKYPGLFKADELHSSVSNNDFRLMIV